MTKPLFYLLLVFSSLPLVANAYNNARNEHAEVYVELRHQDASSLETRSGSFAMDSNLGFGLGFAYNLNRHFNIGVNISNTRADYRAQVLAANKQGGGQTWQKIRHEADHYSFMFIGSYYLLSGDITPVFNAGIGTSTLDSNIADGPGTAYCWYDPWYGYICDSYQSTYKDSSFTYQAGVGMRFDFARNAFLNVLYQKQWQDVSFKTQDKDMEFSIISLQLGGKF